MFSPYALNIYRLQIPTFLVLQDLVQLHPDTCKGLKLTTKTFVDPVDMHFFYKREFCMYQEYCYSTRGILPIINLSLNLREQVTDKFI